MNILIQIPLLLQVSLLVVFFSLLQVLLCPLVCFPQLICCPFPEGLLLEDAFEDSIGHGLSFLDGDGQ